MNIRKKALLEADGWKVGSTQEFLELTSEEETTLTAMLEQRIAEIDSGAVKTIPWEEFRAELRRENSLPVALKSPRS